MSDIIAAAVFFLGLGIAVVSALLVIELKRGWAWYALPSAYCALVLLVRAWISGTRIDVAAIAVFSVLLTLVGWLTVKFDINRH